MPANPIGVLLRNRRAGEQTLAWARPDLQAPEPFALSSPAFLHGAPIPHRYRGRLRGPNVSPPLEWTVPPAGTEELVLLVQDPDVPFGKPATHALAIGVDPGPGRLPEGALSDPSPIAGIRHGRGALGRRGYAGPLPVRSHGPHASVFQLYALDRRLDLPDGFGLPAAVEAMTGHVVARARLDGTYELR